jgi:hypothetical protein
MEAFRTVKTNVFEVKVIWSRYILLTLPMSPV